jgi:hypothetical protein
MSRSLQPCAPLHLPILIFVVILIFTAACTKLDGRCLPMVRSYNDADHAAAGMEIFDPNDVPPQTNDDERVRACDVFVLLMGWRYGNQHARNQV